jgi:hypothetical protein
MIETINQVWNEENFNVVLEHETLKRENQFGTRVFAGNQGKQRVDFI